MTSFPRLTNRPVAEEHPSGITVRAESEVDVETIWGLYHRALNLHRQTPRYELSHPSLLYAGGKSVQQQDLQQDALDHSISKYTNQKLINMVFGQDGNCGLKMSVKPLPRKHRRPPTTSEFKIAAPTKASKGDILIPFPLHLDFETLGMETVGRVGFEDPSFSDNNSYSTREATPPYTRPSPDFGPARTHNRAISAMTLPSTTTKIQNKEMTVSSTSGSGDLVFVTASTPANFNPSPTSSPSTDSSFLMDAEPSFQVALPPPTLTMSATITQVAYDGTKTSQTMTLSQDESALVHQLHVLKRYVQWKGGPVGSQSTISFDEYQDILRSNRALEG